jgi:hypothetical protein
MLRLGFCLAELERHPSVKNNPCMESHIRAADVTRSDLNRVAASY